MSDNKEIIEENNESVKKVNDSLDLTSTKKLPLIEVLKKFSPRLEKITNNKYRLTTIELTEAIKHIGYNVKKNIRSLKTVLIDDKEKQYYFDDDSEAKFEAEIEHKLYSLNITYSQDSFQKALKVFRADNYFCPIQEKIKGLKWDKIPRLNQDFLCKYFKDKDSIFGDYFKAWLVSATGRVFNSSFQSPVWCIGGGQGQGKSYFTDWLVKSTFGVEYHGATAIDPENKDSLAICCEKLTIEIPEGAGTLKKDREILKRHFTTANFELRPLYGKYNVQRPHLASYIATLNLSGLGILKDPTGNRRFLVCELEDKGIDKRYSIDIDPNQLWAEAYQIYLENKDKMMNNYEYLVDIDKRNEINLRYSNSPIVYEYLNELIEFTGNEQDKIKLTDIIKLIQNETSEKISGDILKAQSCEYMLEKYKISIVEGRIGNSNVKHFRGIKAIK